MHRDPPSPPERESRHRAAVADATTDRDPTNAHSTNQETRSNMKAFRCDRCNAYEDGEPVAKVTFTLPAFETATTQKVTTTELCTPCLASLRDWRDEHSTSKDTA